MSELILNLNACDAKFLLDVVRRENNLVKEVNRRGHIDLNKHIETLESIEHRLENLLY